jgi:ribonuclease HII
MCKGDPYELPNVLENIAAYLRKDDSKILHPVGLNQLTSRFKNNLLKDDQCFLLHLLGASHSEIDSYNNISKRVKAFKKLLKEFYEKDTITTDPNGTQSSQGSDKQIRRILLQIRGRYTRGS